jgi:hypothetical protein
MAVSEQTTSLERANEIMGENIFGPAEWERCIIYGLRAEDLEVGAQLPWSEDILTGPCLFFPDKRVCETHFAFLGHTRGGHFNIMSWQRVLLDYLRRYHPAHKDKTLPLFYDKPEWAWYRNKPFATQEALNRRWYLMLKEPPEKFGGHTFQDQVKMLPPGYELPRAVEEATKFILYFIKTGERLNPYVKLRCRDLGEKPDEHIPDGHICVGDCRREGDDEEGLKFTIMPDESYVDWVNIAASRLPGQ